MAKVSIITPVFNTIYWERSLESVLNQTSKDFEWIIVSDGGDYLPEERSAFPFIKQAFLWENYGPSVARNVAFQLSDGDIITYLDMGDELSPDRIEHILYIFNSFDVELLFDGYILIQDDKEYRYNIYEYSQRSYVFNKNGSSNTGYGIPALLQVMNCSTPLGVSHTRKPFVQNGGFQRGIVCGEDGVLWRRMTETISPKKVMASDYIAGKYYVLADSQARTQRRFDMGGFAFDNKDPMGSNGQSLDSSWFSSYNSKELFDEI